MTPPSAPPRVRMARHAGSGNARMLFAGKFLKKARQVASVSPSSRVLAREVCRYVDPSRPQTVVELGAGTGPVTRAVAERMHPQSRLVAVEIDPDFCDVLRRRFPAATVVCGDVQNLASILPSLGVGRVDVVLSGLPTPSLPREVNRALLAWLDLAQPTVFSQLTVMPWVYKRLYEGWFERVEFELVVRNVPPGGVYHCRGLRRPVMAG